MKTETLINQAPMTAQEVANLKAVKATTKLTSISVEEELLFEFTGKPGFEIDTTGSGSSIPKVRLNNVQLGKRVYPTGTNAVGVKALTKREIEDKSGAFQIEGFFPNHADFNPEVQAESANERRPSLLDRDTFFQSSGISAETIFGPDNRLVFNDTSYPWRCFGRVESSLGVGSGVMIGPRHLLTCSHIIDWQPNNTTGWLKFTPAYYNGSAPFGVAWGRLTYYKFKVTPPTVDSTEIQYDYTVVVLDRKIGNTTGWLGSKSYTDAWDGGKYWSHVGYPGDKTGTQRPTFEKNIALDGASILPDAHEYMTHKADVWPGQSGGPFFGWWDGKPYAVAVQSAHNPSDNFASGGSDLVDLVIRARNENP